MNNNKIDIDIKKQLERNKILTLIGHQYVKRNYSMEPLQVKIRYRNKLLNIKRNKTLLKSNLLKKSKTELLDNTNHINLITKEIDIINQELKEVVEFIEKNKIKNNFI